MIAALLALLIGQMTPPPPPSQQNVAPVSAPQVDKLPPAAVDRTFALAAIQGNNAVMAFAALALSRSSTDEVRSFAQKMLIEHQAIAVAGGPLLMHALGAPPPQQMGAPDRLAYERLRVSAPADFDQGYLLQQIGDHLAAMSVFQTEAVRGSTPALRAFARTWLPTIQAHLQLAVIATQHVGGSSPFKTR